MQKSPDMQLQANGSNIKGINPAKQVVNLAGMNKIIANSQLSG